MNSHTSEYLSGRPTYRYFNLLNVFPFVSLVAFPIHIFHFTPLLLRYVTHFLQITSTELGQVCALLSCPCTGIGIMSSWNIFFLHSTIFIVLTFHNCDLEITHIQIQSCPWPTPRSASSLLPQLSPSPRSANQNSLQIILALADVCCQFSWSTSPSRCPLSLLDNWCHLSPSRNQFSTSDVHRLESTMIGITATCPTPISTLSIITIVCFW